MVTVPRSPLYAILTWEQFDTHSPEGMDRHIARTLAFYIFIQIFNTFLPVSKCIGLADRVADRRPETHIIFSKKRFHCIINFRLNPLFVFLEKFNICFINFSGLVAPRQTACNQKE